MRVSRSLLRKVVIIFHRVVIWNIGKQEEYSFHSNYLKSRDFVKILTSELEATNIGAPLGLPTSKRCGALQSLNNGL
jgi:hypothetical protein